MYKESHIFVCQTMNKIVLILVIVLLFLLPALFFINMDLQDSQNTKSVTHAGMLYVDESNQQGPWDGTPEHPYCHVRDAVDNVTNPGAIYVRNGIYYGRLTIDKTVTLIGESTRDTIIDGLYEAVVISIIAPHVTIKNFTIRNSGGYLDNAGIKVESHDNTVADCIIYRTKTGIYVTETAHNAIQNCTFCSNGDGVCLQSSQYTTIKDCQFTHNALGLHLQDTSDTEIMDSYAHTNGIGLFCTGSSNIDILRCASFNNNDNQK